MTKQSRQTARPSATTPFEPMAGLGAFGGELAESYMKASQTFLQNAFDMNQEIMRFASERFTADVAAIQALSKCANWQDAANLQSEFLRSATEAYQAEFNKLVQQSTTANATLTDMLKEAQQASETKTNGG